VVGIAVMSLFRNWKSSRAPKAFICPRIDDIRVNRVFIIRNIPILSNFPSNPAREQYLVYGRLNYTHVKLFEEARLLQEYHGYLTVFKLPRFSNE
jgi:hypothetical protein